MAQFYMHIPADCCCLAERGLLSHHAPPSPQLIGRFCHLPGFLVFKEGVPIYANLDVDLQMQRERENDGRLRVVTNVCQFLLHLVGDLIPLKPNPKGFYTA